MIQEQEDGFEQVVEDGEETHTKADAVEFLLCGVCTLSMPVSRIVEFLEEEKFGYKTVLRQVERIARRWEYHERLMQKVNYNKRHMEDAVAVIEDVLAPRDRGSLKVAVAKKMLQGVPVEALQILFTEHDVPVLDTVEERIVALAEAMAR